MKEYMVPEIEEEVIELEDVIASSGDFGSSLAGERIVDFLGED